MKQAIGIALAFIALSTPAFAGECADAYLQAGLRIQGSTGFGKFTKKVLDYEGALKFFDQNRASALVSMGVLTVALPAVLIIDGGDTIAYSLKAKYHLQVGEALAATGSRQAEKGLRRMYRMIQDDIEIREDDFREFIAAASQGNSLCGFDQRIDLSEKGRERVGDAGFFAYAHRLAGTPEFKEFFNDPGNFQMALGIAPFREHELKQALIRELISKGYPRRAAPEPQALSEVS